MFASYLRRFAPQAHDEGCGVVSVAARAEALDGSWGGREETLTPGDQVREVSLSSCAVTSHLSKP